MKYQETTPEQKESITPYLKGLLEERENINKYYEDKLSKIKEDTEEDIKNATYLGKVWNDRFQIKCAEIKGFQEAIKEIAIKQIDEHFNDFKGCNEIVYTNKIYDFGMQFDNEYRCGEGVTFCEDCKWKQDRIEELKKQKEHLIWESELE